MHEPAPLAADVPSYDVVGRAPAFPVLTKVVLSRFRRPRLPLEPDVSARKFLPDQEEVSLLGDFWQPEENALATPCPGHTPQVNCCFGFECLGQILLQLVIDSLSFLAVHF